jgi:hypothetical protein
LHHVIAGVAVVLAPENVSESHGLCELSGFDQEAGSVCVPAVGHENSRRKNEVSKFQSFGTSNIRKRLSHGRELRLELCELNVNLRAEGGMVNPPIVVQCTCGTKTRRLNFRETRVAEKPL